MTSAETRVQSVRWLNEIGDPKFFTREGPAAENVRMEITKTIMKLPTR